MNSSIWIEVSVNIGKRCLKIEIQRNQSIEQVVNQFITNNKLSVKYEPIISNMIKQEIKNRINVQQAEKPTIANAQSVKSSMSSGLGDPLCNQSFNGKENGLMAEVMKIQTQTNKKRAQKLSELRQTSQTKNSIIMTDRSIDKIKQSQERPSFRKFEVVRPMNHFGGETPKMMVDSSRQSSEQTIVQPVQDSNCSFQKTSKRSFATSNKHSNQNIVEDEGNKQISHELTSDIAELKELLSYNQAYNSHNKSQDEESLWAQNKDRQTKPKRLKTQTPQNIYQRWRKLDQEKKLKSQSKNKDINALAKSKSPLTKREDTFFYNKGKSFLQQKKKKVQTKFHEIYPFKTSKTPVSSRVGIETSNRLFKDSKEYFSKKLVKPKHVDLDLSLKADPIRQKVRQRDKQHDEILSQLISQGRLKSPATIAFKQKSPFRKTVLYN